MILKKIKYDNDTQNVRDTILDIYHGMTSFHTAYAMGDTDEEIRKSFDAFDEAFLKLEHLCDFILKLEGKEKDIA